MKVLDASFPVDYGNGVEAAARYLLDESDERFVVPAPVFTEYLLGGVHSSQPTDVETARSELSWVDVVELDEEVAATAAAVAAEIGPEGPQLAAVDALVAAVGRELDATVVSADSDLTQSETRRVIDVEEYC